MAQVPAELEEFRKPREKKERSMLLLMKEAPMIPIGILLAAGIVGHGFLTVKNRKISLLRFILEYRVKAQGAFIACVTCSAIYKMVTEMRERNTEKESQ